jgi:hypothetical protein
MTAAIRLRRLIAKDALTIQGYDQEEYARRLFYAERPIDASVVGVAAARRTTAEILDQLDEEQWATGRPQTESGPYGVEAWFEIYAAHAPTTRGSDRPGSGARSPPVHGTQRRVMPGILEELRLLDLGLLVGEHPVVTDSAACCAILASGHL